MTKQRCCHSTNDFLDLPINSNDSNNDRKQNDNPKRTTFQNDNPKRTTSQNDNPTTSDGTQNQTIQPECDTRHTRRQPRGLTCTHARTSNLSQTIPPSQTRLSAQMKRQSGAKISRTADANEQTESK